MLLVSLRTGTIVSAAAGNPDLAQQLRDFERQRYEIENKLRETRERLAIWDADIAARNNTFIGRVFMGLLDAIITRP